VGYVALDWHQMDKELGSEALVEAFWTQLGALLPPQVRARQRRPAVRGVPWLGLRFRAAGVCFAATHRF
jgi:hypothetical protein